MTGNPYARKKRQLSVLVKKLHYLLQYHKEDAANQIKKLVSRIKKLVQELSSVVSRADLKKILGAAAIILGISFFNQTTAQSFAAPIENPFGLVSTYYSAFPTFADLDGDGDFDLLVGESGDYLANMQYFENIGSDTVPLFSAPQSNPFGLDSVTYHAVPTFVDLDDDGDMDLLVGDASENVKYFENIGSPTNPQFASPQVNPFGLLPGSGFTGSTFADLDDDGDLDLLCGKFDGVFQYFENTGSSVNPQFASQQENPFGLTLTYIHLFASPDFADLDNDGDMDLLVGVYDEYAGGIGMMQYFENTGSSVNPQFASPQENPFGLNPTLAIASPDFVDLDNDGDMDLLVGEYYGAMHYYENISVISVSEANQNINLLLFPNPVNDKLYIKTDNNIKQVEVLNILGENVTQIQTNVSEISLKNIKPGIYTVKITLANNNCIVRKVIKK